MESFLALLKTGVLLRLRNAGLRLPLFINPTYQYVFAGHMPKGWQIEHGIAASWESECGGVRQLRVLDQIGRPMKISELIQAGVLKGAEVPVGF